MCRGRFLSFSYRVSELNLDKNWWKNEGICSFYFCPLHLEVCLQRIYLQLLDLEQRPCILQLARAEASWLVVGECFLFFE